MNDSRIDLLIEYLKRAKLLQWTLDVGILMQEYHLNKDQVMNCIDLVFNKN